MSKIGKANSLEETSLVRAGLLFGTELLKRRQTFVPNFKNYKNLKYFQNIKKCYDTKEELGQGQYGTVYKVQNKTTGKQYAMKTINKKAINST